MSKNLNESPVIRRNEEYIERLKKRLEKLRDRRNSYERDWSSDVLIYRHKTTNRRMSFEKYEQLNREYYELFRKVRDIEIKENEKVVSKIVPYITAFIVTDKKRNPESYPDWLSLKINDILYGSTIKLQPYIDLEKLLEDKGDLHKSRETYFRVMNFVNRYFSGSGVKIEIEPKIFSGIDDYIKNVFIKEIRPRIMNEVKDSKCIHSIVFRVKGNYNREIQIHPRFKRDYGCRSISRGQISGNLNNILKEYGWVNGLNYTDDTSRD